MNSKNTEKRKDLKELSQKAKELVDGITIKSINQALVKLFYTDKFHKTFKTFDEWKDLGYTIKKEVKSFMIWDKPVELHPQGEPPFTYFPLKHLFSNQQVVKKT